MVNIPLAIEVDIAPIPPCKSDAITVADAIPDAAPSNKYAIVNVLVWSVDTIPDTNRIPVSLLVSILIDVNGPLFAPQMLETGDIASLPFSVVEISC